MLLAENSGGRLTIDTKIDLVPNAQIAEAIIDKRVDMGYFYIPWVSGTFPLWDFGSLPFFFGHPYEYEQAVKDPRLISILEKSYGEFGLVLLCNVAAWDSTTVWAHKPIVTVDDFKGLKMRVAGLIFTYAAEYLGALPLTISAFELTDALARGTVDAILADRPWAFTIGMADVAEYANVWMICPPWCNSVVINEAGFNALPADLQEILKDTAKQFAGQFYYGTEVVSLIINMSIEAAGVTIAYPEPAEVAKARELTKPAIDKWLEIAGPDGPELLAIISEYASGAK